MKRSSPALCSPGCPRLQLGHSMLESVPTRQLGSLRTLLRPVATSWNPSNTGTWGTWCASAWHQNQLLIWPVVGTRKDIITQSPNSLFLLGLLGMFHHDRQAGHKVAHILAGVYAIPFFEDKYGCALLQSILDEKAEEKSHILTIKVSCLDVAATLQHVPGMSSVWVPRDMDNLYKCPLHVSLATFALADHCVQEAQPASLYREKKQSVELYDSRKRCRVRCPRILAFIVWAHAKQLWLECSFCIGCQILCFIPHLPGEGC